MTNLETPTARVLIHIVTYNHESVISRCLEGTLGHPGLVPGENLFVSVFDNASEDTTVEKVSTFMEGRPGFSYYTSSSNIGFSGGHNVGAAQCVALGCNVMIILNPDAFLKSGSINHMLAAFSQGTKVGVVTPKLLRADASLSPLSPSVIDAAGMFITPEIRHLDRGSGEEDLGQYDRQCYVFGATGACLAITTKCILDAAEGLMPTDLGETPPRLQLFDESFFAYREDADLSWRLQWYGWQVLYAPRAVVYHVRRVIPERRRDLPSVLNRFSVRNRFLLELNNWTFGLGFEVFFRGIVIRNALVVFGVLVNEWASLPGLFDVLKGLRVALKRRKVILSRSRVSAKQVSRWFTWRP